MKNSILTMLLLAMTVITFNVNANSNSSCYKKVNKTNRKINCGKNKGCGTKKVRINKFAKKECCPLGN